MQFGGVDSLISLMSHAKDTVVSNACVVLTNMSTQEDVRNEIQKAGIIQALMNVLQSENCDVQVMYKEGTNIIHIIPTIECAQSEIIKHLATWLQHGYNLVTTWVQPGFNLVTTWVQHGYYMVTLLQRGYMVTAWLHVIYNH